MFTRYRTLRLLSAATDGKRSNTQRIRQLVNANIREKVVKLSRLRSRSFVSACVAQDGSGGTWIYVSPA